MKILLLTLLFISSFQAFTQGALSDTVHTLSEVVVSDRRIDRYSAGLQVWSIEKRSYENMPGMLLSDLLSLQSTNFIKTYGAGGLASISIRGTASQHASIYWNGFSINPPNIDIADLSMLPLFIFNQIDMVNGGSSTLFGNGSIGGSIHLNTQNGFRENRFKAAFSMGQHKDRMFGLKTDYKLGQIYLSTAAWYNRAENDFYYKNTAKHGNPRERLSNADVVYKGLVQELHLPISTFQHIKAGFWFQEKEAGVPPTMTMNRSYARQYDRMLRAYAQWSLETQRLSYGFKTGYNNDYLRYTDSLAQIDSRLNVGVFTLEADLTARLSKLSQLTFGVNSQIHDARVEAYQDNANPQQFSIFILSRHEFPKLNWHLNVGARKEYHSDFKNIPPALSIGLNGKIIEHVSGRINLSTNYRTPTLNDRYWVPGGNPDLKAESSINAETGFDLSLQNKEKETALSVTFFNSRINNWITWLPSASSYWSPENVNTVFTYGFETKVITNHTFFKVENGFEISYTAVRSLYGVKSFRDINNQAQLIYTPVHSAAFSYRAGFGKWSLLYFHKLTGSRYTDRANTNKLPAFHTADISLVRTLKFKEMSVRINATVQNLTNHAYQVMEYRPMQEEHLNSHSFQI